MVQFAAGVIAAPIDTWPAAVWKMAAVVPCEHTTAQAFLKSAPTSVLKVAASALIASARYRPGFYPGELTLFTSGGARTRPPVSPGDLAQTRSRSIHCRDRRRPLDDVLRAQRRVRRRILDALSSRARPQPGIELKRFDGYILSGFSRTVCGPPACPAHYRGEGGRPCTRFRCRTGGRTSPRRRTNVPGC